MSKTKPKSGASASAAAAHIFVSNVTFARLLNEGVIQRQPRDVGYDLDVVRAARLSHLERVAAECFEILDNFVRAKLEEIADPAGTAARAANSGVESEIDEPYRGDDNDSEDEDALDEAK